MQIAESTNPGTAGSSGASGPSGKIQRAAAVGGREEASAAPPLGGPGGARGSFQARRRQISKPFWVSALLLATWPGSLLGARQVPSTDQQTVPPGVITGTHDVAPGDAADVSMRHRLEQEREHLAEEERRKRIVADANKLLQLATELKADVDKSSKNELSIQVVNKAAEIEKLSHDVKERMRN